MKRELLKIAKDLDKEKITEREARNLLFGLLNVSQCAFSVYVDGCGRLIVIAKDEKEVAEKMKAEGFTKPFKIMEALSFIA